MFSLYTEAEQKTQNAWPTISPLPAMDKQQPQMLINVSLQKSLNNSLRLKKKNLKWLKDQHNKCTF